MFRRTALLLVLALWVGPTQARDFMVHLTSKHFGREAQDRTLNENNYGLGIKTDSDTIFGAYYNSYKRPTVYLGKEWLYKDTVGGWVALATGYDTVNGLPVTVIGGLSAKVHLTERVGLKIMALPKFKTNPGVIHLGVTYRF